MNKFILQKLMLSLVLSFLIHNSQCMEISKVEEKSNLGPITMQEKGELTLYDLENIKTRIMTSKDIFATAEQVKVYIDNAVLQDFQLNKSNNKVLHISNFLTIKSAQWLAKKILKDKLLEFKKSDSVNLLFDKGIVVSKNITLAENEPFLIAANEKEPCFLTNLPNELILLIFIYSIDSYIDFIEPINEYELDQSSRFTNNFLSAFWRNPKANTDEALAKKRLNALNTNLSLATRKAIRLITHVMLVNKYFYLSSGELSNRLKTKIAKEFLHEKIVEGLINDENSLLTLVLDANRLDVNYKFKRWGYKQLNFLKFFILKALRKRKQGLCIANIEQMLKMLIDHGVNLREDNGDSVLIFSVREQDEDLVIFLLLNIKSMAGDKELLRNALAYNMPKLVKVMIEHRAIIESEDLDIAENYKKAFFLNSFKQNLEQTIEPSWCTIF